MDDIIDRSSDIREILFGENDSIPELEDDCGSDITAVGEDSPSPLFHDLSESDAEDEPYVNEEILSSENEETSVNSGNQPVIHKKNWVRVYPPEKEIEVSENFTVRNPGLRNCPPANSKPLDYFQLFFTNAIWNLLVKETNSYAEKQSKTKKELGEMKKCSRLSYWVDVSLKEMKKFIAIMLNMGLTKRKNVTHYWSTADSQRIPFYPNNMSLRRFELLSSMFHLSSSDKIAKGQPGYDPWHKIRVFFDSINNSFKKYFVPYQNICIDESMIGMKNRCSYIVYTANKRHARFGIKKFELCDSSTNYVVHVELYCGKDFLADSNDPFTQKVIFELMLKSRLLGKGYHLFTDNFYTKLPLAEKLIANNTYLTGTVNKNSKDLSKTVLKTKLTERETVYFRRENILLVGYIEKKTRKPVYVITTGCHAEDKIIRSKSGREGKKPLLIHKYNLNMGGVDCKDKSIYHLSCTRPSKKYWKKIFFNLVDMCVFNSYVLYTKNVENPMSRHDFVVNIVESLVAEELVPDLRIQDEPATTSHELSHLPGRKERLCAVCGPTKKRGRSHYWCPGCNCGVHPACFHLLEHYWRPTKPGRKRKAPSSDSE